MVQFHSGGSYSTLMNKKKRIKYQKKYRKRNYDKLICIDCWKPLEENNLRLRCNKCSRQNVCRDTYRIWFNKQFS